MISKKKFPFVGLCQYIRACCHQSHALLAWGRKVRGTVRNCPSTIPRPGDELFQQILNIPDASQDGLKRLQYQPQLFRDMSNMYCKIVDELVEERCYFTSRTVHHLSANIAVEIFSHHARGSGNGPGNKDEQDK